MKRKTDSNSCCLIIARAVHFRNLTRCFEVHGIDISARFRYDREILRDTCLNFHGSNEVLIICSSQMKEIYESFNLLLKSYKSSSISIVFVTLDELEIFLTKSNQSVLSE